jgi:transposase
MAVQVQRLSTLVEHLVAENYQWRERWSALSADHERLLGAVQGLQAENQKLREEVHRLKKNSSNSSKPPSSDIVKPPPPVPRRRGKRKAGGQPGHPKHERTPFGPDRIDEIRRYEWPAKAAGGLTPLDDWEVLQQVELAERPVWVTEHRARKYLNPTTGQILTAPFPAALVQAGLVGPRLSALIGYAKSAGHMSYTTIGVFLNEVLGVSLSTGQLAKVIQKVSAALAEPYRQVRQALTGQSFVGVDETGHPEKGRNLWTWCFRADDVTVFHIDPVRGSAVLQEVLGETFGGVIGCDYFGAYRAYMTKANATMQFCLAHLIRDIRYLEEHPVPAMARWGKNLLGQMRKLFHTLHRRASLTAAGFARSMDRIRRRFLNLVRRPPPSEPEALSARFRDPTLAAAYFTFLTTPNVEPTNNRTERALRPIVIDRRITQGTRGERGRRWCERAWTVLATCAQQGRSAFAFLCQAIAAYFHRQPAPSLLK